MAASTESNQEQNSRPASPARISPYDTMVVESHQVQSRYNILAAVFNWLVLAGFVVFPATFASLSRVGVLNNSPTGRAVQSAIRNIPLLYICAFACVLGGLGLAWLWWTVKHNYVWLLSRIFLYAPRS
ncbi:Sulfite reductase [NADPH] flavoprotein component [Verticillium dahliae VDG2]|nr:Sulfite reductase [NADPH] flavoprotein component [Verticillium dahliae VDG2]